MGVYNFGETNTLAFETSFSNYTTLDQALAAERLRLDEWVHVAAVSGPGGMKLYADGVLVGTHASSNSFATIGNGRNYLGLPNTHDFSLPNFPKFTDAPCHGEMDEVRVWRVARSEAQIRETMRSKLTGQEAGLVGLWSFDDPLNPGRDASPGAHHGKLVGSAKVVQTRRPGGSAAEVSIVDEPLTTLQPVEQRTTNMLRLDGDNGAMIVEALRGFGAGGN